MENSPHIKNILASCPFLAETCIEKNKGLQTELDFLLTEGGAKKKEICAKECLC